MSGAPACFDCIYEGLDFPCRRNGDFDAHTLAAAYFENVTRDVSGTGEGGGHWSFSCMLALTRDAPDLAWQTICALLDRLETVKDAEHLAAGALEDLIAESGSVLIDRIETLARCSPRFRFVLSGVWPQGMQDSDAWNRVLRARQRGPSISSGAVLPED